MALGVYWLQVLRIDGRQKSSVAWSRPRNPWEGHVEEVSKAGLRARRHRVGGGHGSGSAVAASKITSAQIKDGTITTKDIKNDTLTMSDISARLFDQLSGAQGPAGPAGPSGPAGPAGPAGPSAVAGITVVRGPQVLFGPTDIVKAATAFCPAGQRVVSGGGASITDEELAVSEATSDRSGWFVIGVDEFDGSGEYVQARHRALPPDSSPRQPRIARARSVTSPRL